jgi:hypothetical protein
MCFAWDIARRPSRYRTGSGKGRTERMFKVYDATSTGTISDLVKKLNQLEPADWTEATAVYRIVR